MRRRGKEKEKEDKQGEKEEEEENEDEKERKGEGRQARGEGRGRELKGPLKNKCMNREDNMDIIVMCHVLNIHMRRIIMFDKHYSKIKSK